MVNLEMDSQFLNQHEVIETISVVSAFASPKRSFHSESQAVAANIMILLNPFFYHSWHCLDKLVDVLDE